MISSVQNVNTVERSPFNDFSQRGNYYLTKEIAKDIYDIKEVEEQKKGKKGVQQAFGVGVFHPASLLIHGLKNVFYFCCISILYYSMTGCFCQSPYRTRAILSSAWAW